jgi:ribonuclease HI
MWPEKVYVYTDGACRGNPGPASIGIQFLTTNNETILEFGEPIGVTTNNVAEYSAVLKALQMCVEEKVKQVFLFSDSQLLIKQLNGEYEVKSPNLIDLFFSCKALLRNFERIVFMHIPRERNVVADRLANEALDK